MLISLYFVPGRTSSSPRFRSLSYPRCCFLGHSIFPFCSRLSRSRLFFFPVWAASFCHFVSSFLCSLFFYLLAGLATFPLSLSLFYFHFSALANVGSFISFFHPFSRRERTVAFFLFPRSPPRTTLAKRVPLVFSFSSFLFRADTCCFARGESVVSVAPGSPASRVCGPRETIMGRTGWPCPPQDIGCRGEIGNRV